ncbi:MAG: phosphatidylglycerophosphatase A [Thermodesulfovibrionales bacterium]
MDREGQRSELRSKAAIIISSLFYTGYIPLAPGTFGTVIALVFLMIFKIEGFIFYSFLLFILILGIYVSDKAEQATGEKDSRHIVIDEFAGYMVSMAGVTPQWKNLLIAFLLFRFFDILKPFPIRDIERRLSGGLAIMLDDIIAGLYSNIILRLLIVIALL